MKKPTIRFIQKLKKVPAVPISVLVAIAASGLLLVNLLSLVPFTAKESAVQLGALSRDAIVQDVSFAPIKAVQLSILEFSDNDMLLRLASVAAAVAAAWLLYLMLRKWHTQRVSLLTSAMFITSSLFLYLGRSINHEVMYLSTIPGLLLICMWLLSKKDDKKLVFAAVLFGLLLYIPGTWLFILAGVIFLRKALLKTIRSVNKLNLTASTVAFLATVAPLVYGLFQNSSKAIYLLGINTDQTGSSLLSHIIDVPKQLVYSGPGDPSTWLVGTPVFEVFTLAMIILGTYAYRAGYYPAREKLVFGSLIIGLILVLFGNIATIALLLPIFYILVANGLSYMLQSWFTVFPKNPVARPLGLVLLIVVISGSCAYQLQRYYVAWPSTQTSSVATHKSLA